MKHNCQNLPIFFHPKGWRVLAVKFSYNGIKSFTKLGLEDVMKKLGLVLVLLSLLLAGCGASNPPAEPSIVKPTATQAPPTPTPEPTATPTPEPTATPEPTLIPVDELMEQMGFEDMAALMQAEAQEYQSGYYRWAIGLSNVILDNWLEDYPLIYFQRAGAYAKLGNFEHAIKDLEIAVQLPAMQQFNQNPQDQRFPMENFTANEIDMISNLYNNLCWYLAITNQPEAALPYCEVAVTLFPSAAFLDSRAVVYAMLGRNEDALREFKQVLLLTEDDPYGLYAEMKEQRQQWVTALQDGDNPFNPQFLEQLRQESIDPNAYPEPVILEDFSGEHFIEVLEKDGFILVEKGVNNRGVDYAFYGLKAGNCAIRVILFEPEENFSEAKMILNNCTETQYIAELRWFFKFLLLDDPNQDTDCIDLGKWRAWELTELQDLLSGEIQHTEEFSIRQFNFYAEAEQDSEDDLWVTLYGY